jgi:ornithine carbamoyltransferase
MTKDLLQILDLSRKDVQAIMGRTRELKDLRRAGVPHRSLLGKTVGLLFDKPSTRTRASFEAGMYQLGGQVIFLPGRDTQLSRDEPLGDTARVLSRYLDGLVVRTFGHEGLVELAAAATVPVINALTDSFHPCQVMSDLFTVLEVKGRLEGLKYAWVGDGNNMANSWINAAALLGLNLVLACPEAFQPDGSVLARARERGARVKVVGDPQEAANGADVLSTDVWASMGQEAEAEERRRAFSGFTVSRELLAGADSGAIVLHCLPAHRGEEITEEVLMGPQSVVFDQAENKMHVQKAILDLWLGDGAAGRGGRG